MKKTILGLMAISTMGFATSEVKTDIVLEQPVVKGATPLLKHTGSADVELLNDNGFTVNGYGKFTHNNLILKDSYGSINFKGFIFDKEDTKVGLRLGYEKLGTLAVDVNLEKELGVEYKNSHKINTELEVEGGIRTEIKFFKPSKKIHTYDDILYRIDKTKKELEAVEEGDEHKEERDRITEKLTILYRDLDETTGGKSIEEALKNNETTLSLGLKYKKDNYKIDNKLSYGISYNNAKSKEQIGEEGHKVTPMAKTMKNKLVFENDSMYDLTMYNTELTNKTKLTYINDSFTRNEKENEKINFVSLEQTNSAIYKTSFKGVEFRPELELKNQYTYQQNKQMIPNETVEGGVETTKVTNHSYVLSINPKLEISYMIIDGLKIKGNVGFENMFATNKLSKNGEKQDALSSKFMYGGTMFKAGLGVQYTW